MGALKKCVEQVLTDVSSTAEDSETVAADIASVALSCCIWRGHIRTHSRMMFRVITFAQQQLQVNIGNLPTYV